MRQSMKKSSRDRVSQRSGVAAVELAVCIPVISLIVFASIEACSMIFLQQAIQATAYETARFAVAPRSTSASAITRGQTVLDDRRVRGGTIELDPSDMSTTDAGEEVEVTVTVPLDLNRIMPTFFYGSQTLRAQVTMLRE